jgi:hypothetical protein
LGNKSLDELGVLYIFSHFTVPMNLALQSVVICMDAHSEVLSIPFDFRAVTQTTPTSTLTPRRSNYDHRYRKVV